MSLFDIFSFVIAGRIAQEFEYAALQNRLHTAQEQYQSYTSGYSITIEFEPRVIGHLRNTRINKRRLKL